MLHTTFFAGIQEFVFKPWCTETCFHTLQHRNLLSYSGLKKRKKVHYSTEICFHTLEYKNLLLHTVSSHTGAQNLLSHSKIPTYAFTNCAAKLTPGPGIPGMLGGPPGPGFIMYIASPEPAESATKWSVPRQHCLHHQVRVTFNNKAISAGHLSHRAKQRKKNLYPLHLVSKNNKQTNNKQFKHVLTSEAALTLRCFRRVQAHGYKLNFQLLLHTMYEVCRQ